MKRIGGIILFLILACNTNAQNKHDYIWMFGHTPEEEPEWYEGSYELNFNYSPPRIIEKERHSYFGQVGSYVSNVDGELTFYTNYSQIFDTMNNMMPVDEGINFHLFSDNSIIVPKPDTKDVYNLVYGFHTNQSFILDIFSPNPRFYNFQAFDSIFFTTIDMRQNNGLGKVTEHNQFVLSDSLSWSTVNTTRHANGRDWWFLFYQVPTNAFIRYLLTSDGFNMMGKQEMTEEVNYIPTTEFFSPDGSKYVRLYWDENAYAPSPPDGLLKSRIELYDFDRCSGDLIQLDTFNYSDSTFTAFGQFSSNSELLYLSDGRKIFQFDMNATDILDSKYYLDSAFVAQEANPPFFSGHRYSSMQLGPDSKIYIMRYGNETILHSINNPNMHEIEANFKGNAIFLPKDNDFELPVFPNYRLGALAGSPCDTLTSNINILQEKLQKTINVYPNPFTDLIRIESKEALNFTFQIYDAIGMKVYDQSIQSFQNKQELNVKSLKEGIYYYHILSDYQKLKSGKLIKI